MVVRDVFTHPAPEGFDGHEIRAVTGQRNQLNGQLVRLLTYGMRTVVGGTIQEQDDFLIGRSMAYTPQDIQGIFGIGPFISPRAMIACTCSTKASRAAVLARLRSAFAFFHEKPSFFKALRTVSRQQRRPKRS